MANSEHIRILREDGVEVWNKWRVQNPDIIPQLDDAEFFGANLKAALLFKANFKAAVLSKANLCRADLSEADLSRAYLSCTDLCQAKLDGIRNWKAIECLKHANIFGVRDAPDGFVEWAIETKGAVAIESTAEKSTDFALFNNVE